MKGFDKEAFFIQCLRDSDVVQGIGDDCCVLGSKAYPKRHKALISHHFKPHQKMVIGMDSFCEGVHFLRGWFKPYEIAKKAFLVNYSDLVAMNARAKYAMLSIVIPTDWGRSEMRDFVRGLAQYAQKYKVKIIGGDTIIGCSLQIHMTFFGVGRKLIYRDLIPQGSRLYYTSDRYYRNSIGQSIKVLKTLLNTPKNGASAFAKGRFLRPEIRTGFVRDCASFLRGGMDISDSILSELDRLGQINHLKLSPSPKLTPHIKRTWSSGEEYEMLVAIAPKDNLKLKRIATKHRIHLGYIGTLQRGRMRLNPPKWH